MFQNVPKHPAGMDIWWYVIFYDTWCTFKTVNRIFMAHRLFFGRWTGRTRLRKTWNSEVSTSWYSEHVTLHCWIDIGICWWAFIEQKHRVTRVIHCIQEAAPPLSDWCHLLTSARFLARPDFVSRARSCKISQVLMLNCEIGTCTDHFRNTQPTTGMFSLQKRFWTAILGISCRESFNIF